MNHGQWQAYIREHMTAVDANGDDFISMTAAWLGQQPDRVGDNFVNHMVEWFEGLSIHTRGGTDAEA